MKYEGFKISKESVDKVFRKEDIDIMGYQSPIEIVIGQMRMEQENNIYKVIQEQGVNVDKNELIKALQYDREQYEKGYINGYNAKASEVAREIFEEIEKLTANVYNDFMFNRDGVGMNAHYVVQFSDELDIAIAELKKKYTEEGK